MFDIFFKAVCKWHSQVAVDEFDKFDLVWKLSFNSKDWTEILH